jgi:four helix bundle protein
MRLEDVKIYNKAHQLAVRLHKLSLELPSFEMYEEGSQIRRSSKSVSAQIAEGYSLRDYKNEYLHYLARAYASNRETKEHLDLLFETQSIKDKSLHQVLTQEIDELSKMIFVFIQSVRDNHKLPKLKHSGIHVRSESTISHLPSEI